MNDKPVFDAGHVDARNYHRALRDGFALLNAHENVARGGWNEYFGGLPIMDPVREFGLPFLNKVENIIAKVVKNKYQIHPEAPRDLLPVRVFAYEPASTMHELSVPSTLVYCNSDTGNERYADLEAMLEAEKGLPANADLLRAVSLQYPEVKHFWFPV